MVRPFLLALALFLPFSLFAAAQDAEQTQFGRDIRIEAGQKVGDVTCVNCSIHLAGASSGEVTALHGNIVLEPGGSAAGAVTSLLGDVRVQAGASIAGEVTAIGGSVQRSPGSNIGGDVTALSGTFWVLAIVLPPIFGLATIAALIVWIVQRVRNRATAAQPAQALAR